MHRIVDEDITFYTELTVAFRTHSPETGPIGPANSYIATYTTSDIWIATIFQLRPFTTLRYV